MAPKIFGPYDRPEKALEEGGGPSLTQVSGYIPAKVQIERMTLAGRRLAIARAEEFDLGPGEDDTGFELGPRTPGYDLADASRDARTVRERLIARNQERQAAKKAAEEAAAKAKLEFELERASKLGDKAPK